MIVKNKIWTSIFVLGIVLGISVFIYFRMPETASAHPSPKIIPAGSEIDNETIARIDRFGRSFAGWLESSFNSAIVPSVSAGIVWGDTLVYHHSMNATIDTPFGIASLSKTFTAVLIMRLVEQGTLSLDDPVRRYLPGVVIERISIGSVPVTIRHLLAHTSGMPSYGAMTTGRLPGGRIIGFQTQVHPAGYSYSYNNEGYVILMHIVEAATGRTYPELMREMVLQPLDMTSSSADCSNGTGGIRTTLRDLAKYTAMLNNRGVYRGKRILSEVSFEKMLDKNVELPPASIDYYYSLSWEVITVEGKVDSFYKAGRWFNEASGLQVFPEKGIALIYLCNPQQHLSSAFMGWRQGLTGALRGLLRNIVGDQKLCSRWPMHTVQELRRYEGNYINQLTKEKIEIKFRQGQLVSIRNGNPTPLKSFTSNRFVRPDGRGIHDFVWRDQQVIGLALQSGFYQSK